MLNSDSLTTGDPTLDQIQRPVMIGVQPHIYESGRGDVDFQVERPYNLYADDRILKQMRSQMVTTGLISAEQREKEIKELEIAANEIVEIAHKSKQKSIKDLTLQQILTNVSDTVVGLSRDIFLKPNDKKWGVYIQEILLKKDRYVYIGVILIFIVLYIYVFKRRPS